MKAEITLDGLIELTPENQSEHYAIKKALYDRRDQELSEVVSGKPLK